MKGLYAAVITPRKLDGQVDQKALHRLLQFLLENGIEGFALNGATGEFSRTTLAESEAVFEVAAEVTKRIGQFLAGIWKWRRGHDHQAWPTGAKVWC